MIELFKLYILTLSFFSNMLVYPLLLFCIRTLNQYCLVKVKKRNENKVLKLENSVLKYVLVCIEFFHLLVFVLFFFMENRQPSLCVRKTREIR